MNDEAQPSHFSVETAGYPEATGFAAEETEHSEEPGLGEAAGRSPELDRFSAPATGFPPARGFSLGLSGFSEDTEFAPAEAEPSPAEPEFSAEPEPPEEAKVPEETEAPEENRFSFLGETRFQGEARLPEETRFSLFSTGSRFSAEPAGPPAETAEVPVEAAAETPSETVEVPAKTSPQLPARTTGELSVLRTPELPAGMDARLPDGLWAYESYPVVDSVPAAQDQGGVVSLGYIGAAIRRKKKVWCATTALGVLVAAGLYTTYHAKYTDTATVMLALDPSLDAASAIQTDAILAVDSTMAQQAMQKLGVQETVPNFLKTYTVAVSTTANNLLTFTATGATPTAAYNEASTLASVFLRYRAQTELEKESANTAAQDQQVTQTRQTLSTLKKQITKVKAEPYSTAQQSRLTRLQNEQVSAQNLLVSLQQSVASSVATSQSATASLIAGSRVVDTGIPASGPTRTKHAIEYCGGAIAGGLVLGLLIVAIGAVVSDRLRRRDDVAAALGAPVRVSVASSGGKRSRQGGQQADLKRVAAHLRGCVQSGSGGAGSLVVVAVDKTKFASAAVKELAIASAREGKRVVVADLSGGALGEQFGTKEPGIRGVDAGGVRLVLVTPERGDLAPIGPLHQSSLGTPMNGIANVHAAADLFITLATVNPATGGAHLKTWGDDVVAVVTAGESSVTRVQAVGEMIRFAGARLTSAVLLGADGEDESLGYVTA